MKRTTRLPDDPKTAALAREFVREALDQWRLENLKPDASLLATELVTNGLRHGGGPRSMTLSARAGRLRIEVADNEPLLSPRRRPAPPTAEGGRGLALVEAVADTWGTRRLFLRKGKIVWCELKI
jgi:anti-sigma regulatory factor (Ser/Thr protein kinase)